MTVFEALLLSLAAWRLTHLFVYEAGFLNIADRVRGLANRWPETWGEVFACPKCLGVWMSAFVCLAYLATTDWRPTAFMFVMFVFAMSGLVMYLEWVFKRLQIR